ncbi:sensor histidine kinase [Paenibacillus dakarensis]|uniref:sensor histidine kinase n=1 Tax=Paenibacillus dakarensis TaxID=1527293 RepID=UPI0006D546B7|nr:sensor histidine kinase [Paenibacillus dakarensis]
MKQAIHFYRKHIHQKLFNKILVAYSIITIFSLAALSAFVYTYLVNSQVKKDLNVNTQAVSNINNYLDMRHAISQQIFQQIYHDGSSTLMDDVTSFLNNDFSDYLDDRLMQYSSTGIRRREIVAYLRLQLVNYPDIRAIALYSPKKQVLFTQTKDAQYYENVSGNLESILDEHMVTDRSFVTISNLTSLTTLESIGNLIIDYKSEGIKKAYQNNGDEMKGYVLVLAPNGNVIFDSSNRYYGQQYPYHSKINASFSTQELEQSSYVTLQTTNRFGYWVVGVVPKSEITNSLIGLRNTLLLGTGVCILAAMLLTYFTIINFSRRTKVIVRAIEKLKKGDLSVRIPREKEDELFQIADRFNEMCEDLSKYIDRVYISEIRQKKAELAAFQSQINPHFLYNTLEAIRMRAHHKKADDVGEMIYLLSSIFRYSVKTDTIVTLANEIEYCTLYLDLFRIRYMNNFSYEIDVEPELMNYEVLKLSIQPIIENYIVHGLRMSHSDNRIQIQAKQYGGDLYITVRDNGSGISSDKLELIRRRLNGEHNTTANSSIGLSNTHERIKICFGSEYGLHIDHERTHGAIITMKIPAHQGGQLHHA